MSQQLGFARIVGQEDLIRRLRAFADLYRNNGGVPGHVLLVGPDGHGKRSIACALAEHYHVASKELSSDVPMKLGDLRAVLTNLEVADILVIPEINRLSASLRNALARALT